MTAISQILLTLRMLRRAPSLLQKARLNWIYLVPFALYILFFILGFSLTNGIHDYLISRIETAVLDYYETIPYFESMMKVTSVLFWLVIKIMLFLIIGSVSGYLILILLAPLLTYVSERVHVADGGLAPPFNLNRFMKDLWRALYIAVRNGLIQLVILLLFFMAGFIPGVNFITTPVFFLISAYYYGFSLLDYSFERGGYSVQESVRAARSLKWSAMTLGAVFLFVAAIPWVGILLSTLLLFHLVTSATLVVKKMHET